MVPQTSQTMTTYLELEGIMLTLGYFLVKYGIDMPTWLGGRLFYRLGVRIIAPTL